MTMVAMVPKLDKNVLFHLYYGTVNKSQEERGKKNNVASVLLSLSPEAQIEGMNVARTGTNISNKNNQNGARDQTAAPGTNPTCCLLLYSLQAKNVVLFSFLND